MKRTFEEETINDEKISLLETRTRICEKNNFTKFLHFEIYNLVEMLSTFGGHTLMAVVVAQLAERSLPTQEVRRNYSTLK